jgi:hypothetical protein
MHLSFPKLGRILGHHCTQHVRWNCTRNSTKCRRHLSPVSWLRFFARPPWPCNPEKQRCFSREVKKVRFRVSCCLARSRRRHGVARLRCKSLKLWSNTVRTSARWCRQAITSLNGRVCLLASTSSTWQTWICVCMSGGLWVTGCMFAVTLLPGQHKQS